MASAGTVVAKSAADAIIITGARAGKESVEFLYGRLGTAQPQLQRPTHGRQQIVSI
jgi:predicted TIM-barrel enzyme